MEAGHVNTYAHPCSRYGSSSSSRNRIFPNPVPSGLASASTPDPPLLGYLTKSDDRTGPDYRTRPEWNESYSRQGCTQHPRDPSDCTLWYGTLGTHPVKAVARGLPFGAEALRVEAHRLIPHMVRAAHRVRAHEHHLVRHHLLPAHRRH
eukprot:1184788-Prorocentrum_minimum.AAC.2